jgi:antagonist of KipI
VAGVDLGLLAQARPGDRIRFTEITLAEAHALRARQETHLRLARVGLARFADGA